MNKEEASGWGFLQPAPNAEAIASLMQRKSKNVWTADSDSPIGDVEKRSSARRSPIKNQTPFFDVDYIEVKQDGNGGWFVEVTE